LKGEEFLFSDQVSDRASFNALADQISKAGSRGVRGRFFIPSVELDTPASERMRQQDLGIESREFRALLDEILSGPVQKLAYCPALFGC
jgi:hypothetical protein